MWKPGTEKPKPERSASAPPSRTLSGATTSMRFMQRRKQEQQQQAAPSSSKQLEESHDSMQVTAEAEEAGMFQVATPLDMYGIQAQALGRRSFGGFNSVTQENWYGSVHGGGSDRKKHGKKQSSAISDEELLQRYEAFVKNGRKGTIDTSSGEAKKRRKRHGSNPHPVKRGRKEDL